VRKGVRKKEGRKEGRKEGATRQIGSSYFSRRVVVLLESTVPVQRFCRVECREEWKSGTFGRNSKNKGEKEADETSSTVLAKGREKRTCETERTVLQGACTERRSAGAMS
jgi:hypothetical protein